MRAILAASAKRPYWNALSQAGRATTVRAACCFGSRSARPTEGKQPFSFSKRLYKLRWRIENAFNRLKDFRRIRHTIRQAGAKLLSLCLCLAAALVWWI